MTPSDSPTSPQPPHWGVAQTRIDANWRSITFELDAPRPGRVERLLRTVGLPAHVTRLMVATPALRRAWYIAVGLAVLGATGPYDAAKTEEQLFTLLLLAPLVPVVGVSLAYGIEADPAHEIAVATPMRGLRLVMTRTVVVLGMSIAILAVAAALAPGRSPMAFAWLLPALATTSSTVALMTRLPPRRAALVTTAAWVAGVAVVTLPAADRLNAFRAPTQVLACLITAVCLAVIWGHREGYDRLDVGTGAR